MSQLVGLSPRSPFNVSLSHTSSEGTSACRLFLFPLIFTLQQPGGHLVILERVQGPYELQLHSTGELRKRTSSSSQGEQVTPSGVVAGMP